MEARKEDKIALLKQKIQLVANSIYVASVDARVAKKVGDENMESRAISDLKQFEMMRDAYEEELKLLE